MINKFTNYVHEVPFDTNEAGDFLYLFMERKSSFEAVYILAQSVAVLRSVLPVTAMRNIHGLATRILVDRRDYISNCLDRALSASDTSLEVSEVVNTKYEFRGSTKKNVIFSLKNILMGQPASYPQDLYDFLKVANLPDFVKAVLINAASMKVRYEKEFALPIFYFQAGKISAILINDNVERYIIPKTTKCRDINVLTFKSTTAQNSDYILGLLSNVSMHMKFIPSRSMDTLSFSRFIALLREFIFHKFLYEDKVLVTIPTLKRGHMYIVRDMFIKLFPSDVPQGPVTLQILSIIEKGMKFNVGRRSTDLVSTVEGYTGKDPEVDVVPDEPIKDSKVQIILRKGKDVSISDYITIRIGIKTLREILKSNKELPAVDKLFIKEVLDFWVYRLTPESLNSIVSKYAKVVKVEETDTVEVSSDD